MKHRKMHLFLYKALRFLVGPFIKLSMGYQCAKAKGPNTPSIIIANHIANISQSTADRIRDIVMAGVAKGKSNDRIAAELTKAIPDIAKARAATIARTETHAAATAATNETIRFKNVRIKSKTWWTRRDELVRATHTEVHGVSVPFDEPFDVGASQLMFPGDDSLGADASELINCRCSALYNTS